MLNGYKIFWRNASVVVVEEEFHRLMSSHCFWFHLEQNNRSWRVRSGLHLHVQTVQNIHHSSGRSQVRVRACVQGPAHRLAEDVCYYRGRRRCFLNRNSTWKMCVFFVSEQFLMLVNIRRVWCKTWKYFLWKLRKLTRQIFNLITEGWKHFWYQTVNVLHCQIII